MEALERRILLSGFNGSNPGWNNIRMGLIYWDGGETPGGAWDITEGDSSVVVALLDPTGVNQPDPSRQDQGDADLRDHIWSNPNDPNPPSGDDDGNGYPDDLHGWNFVQGNSDTYGTPTSHGTTAAKYLAARGDDNGYGSTGVNWNVQVMPVKSNGLAWAIMYVVGLRQRGANVRVVNISYREPDYFPTQADYYAIQEAANTGILVVTAAGNAPHQNLDANPRYPPCYALDNIIVVTETNQADELTATANYGQTSVDIAAPGGYGTSFSTPEVSGLAALAFTIVPDASYQTVRDAILQGADHVTPLDGKVAGGRRANARRTLELLNPASMTINGDLNGTATDDTILVRPDPANSAVLQVLINGVAKPKFAKPIASLQSIAVNGIGGNDAITIDPAITLPVFLSGGKGNDTIAGGGNDIITAGDPYDDPAVDWGNDSIDGGAGSDTLRVKGGTLTIKSGANLETLEISGTASLNIDPAGSIDLADNDLIIRASPATRDAVLAQAFNWVRSARAGGAWTGPGLTSSAAGNDQRRMTALGLALNDKGGGQGPLYTTFSGQSVDTNCILVKYTWYGDANLDGVVNADD